MGRLWPDVLSGVRAALQPLKILGLGEGQLTAGGPLLTLPATTSRSPVLQSCHSNVRSTLKPADLGYLAKLGRQFSGRLPFRFQRVFSPASARLA